jgi:hypothetical protein
VKPYFKIPKDKRKKTKNQALVVHACNPSYLGDRDQEDHGISTNKLGMVVMCLASQEG